MRVRQIGQGSPRAAGSLLALGVGALIAAAALNGALSLALLCAGVVLVLVSGIVLGRRPTVR